MAPILFPTVFHKYSHAHKHSSSLTLSATVNHKHAAAHISSIIKRGREFRQRNTFVRLKLCGGWRAVRYWMAPRKMYTAGGGQSQQKRPTRGTLRGLMTNILHTA